MSQVAQVHDSVRAPRRVCFPFIGDLIGGSYYSSLLLAENLDRSKYEPIIVVHEEGHFARELREQGIAYDLVRVPTFVGTTAGLTRHAKAIAHTLPRLLRYLRSRGISIVHTNEWPLHHTWALPARLSGCALVWHQRGMLSESRLDTTMRALADHVLCVSNFVLDQLPTTLLSRSTVVESPFKTKAGDLPNRGDARKTLREELVLDSDVSIVGYFGNLWEVKRPDVFVDAAARIDKAFAGRVAFVMFGDDRQGRIAELRKRVQEYGLEQALHFMGFRTPGPYWIAACDLMLAPAVGDAFPRTVVEAALAGVPVIAANSGGHPEIITHGETGILVEPDDRIAMAEAAILLLRDRDKSTAIAGAAREAARRRFSADEHARQIEAIYDQVMASR